MIMQYDSKIIEGKKVKANPFQARLRLLNLFWCQPMYSAFHLLLLLIEMG